MTKTAVTRKVVKTAAAMFALVGIGCSSAMADASTRNGPYPRLTALGDSISFGYNLDPQNLHPSRKAFPFLIGKDMQYQVRDLAVPGWTSADLLHALETERNLQSSVKYANVVTIDIGSNDILRIASKDGLLSPTNVNPQVSSDELKQFAKATLQTGANLAQIVSYVKLLSPHAKVVLYNLYDPIPPSALTLHKIAEPLVRAENIAITGVAKLYGLPVADAYTAFNGQQSIDVRLGDVHPTMEGQEVLAEAGEKAIRQAQREEPLSLNKRLISVR